MIYILLALVLNLSKVEIFDNESKIFCSQKS